MKPTLTFIFMLVTCMGVFAQAQKNDVESKVEAFSMPITETMVQTNLGKSIPSVTGVYMSKHSRVKRALSFKSRKRRPRLA
ncbi:hypothetical protein J8L85_17820 [Maribacter sp. MMG018]|uniref:hypothetical protein n=1 Tax=Maribacter sp. MMG018 TaxID=2822688 RepID=UPI001B385BB0|nr:hypothetical protein [Maribacter sp. MMG018]MBQ4916312.1 hypothetical protein [Maribacter sp. MMG018]